MGAILVGVYYLLEALEPKFMPIFGSIVIYIGSLFFATVSYFTTYALYQKHTGIAVFNSSTPQTFNIQVGGGQYAPYAQWDLKCSDGASLSGGVPFSGQLNVSSFGTSCTLEMTSSSNGWKRNTWRGFG